MPCRQFAVAVALIAVFAAAALAVQTGTNYPKCKGAWKWTLNGTPEKGKVKGNIYLAKGDELEGNFVLNNGCDGTYEAYDFIKLGPGRFKATDGYVLVYDPATDGFYDYDVIGANVTFKKNNKGKRIATAVLKATMTDGPNVGSVLNLKLTNVK